MHSFSTRESLPKVFSTFMPSEITSSNSVFKIVCAIFSENPVLPKFKITSKTSRILPLSGAPNSFSSPSKKFKFKEFIYSLMLIISFFAFFERSNVYISSLEIRLNLYLALRIILLIYEGEILLFSVVLQAVFSPVFKVETRYFIKFKMPKSKTVSREISSEL